MLKKISLIFAVLMCSALAWAQTPTGGVKGTVINRTDRSPIFDARLMLVTQARERVATANTDSDGNFLITGLKDGVYTLVIAADNYVTTRVNVTVVKGTVKDMFTISVYPIIRQNETTSDEEHADYDLEDSGYDDSPTILYGQNDVFNNQAGYNFSSIRFKTRGFNSEAQDVYLAGIKMNDAITGYSPYSLWSGLNEATRTKYTVNGSEISDYGFGGYNGLTNIPANASNIRKGWRASAMTNSSLYRLRLMLTYASGVQDNGWSYAFSVSARLGGNDWINGVFYRSFGYYLGIEKAFSRVHRIGFTFMGTPGTRGAQNASTQEVYNLMGDNMYNSNWGYQNGKRRNARERRTHEPIAILKYDFNPSDKFKASLTTLYRFGKNGYTALDWYDAADPRPDYYRNLPSYFLMDNEDYNRINLQKYLWAKDAWEQNIKTITQVNWDRLYDVNKHSTTASGLRSKYVQEERRVDQKDLNVALNFKWTPFRWWVVTAGANAKWNKTENYKKIADLLGGEYFVNIDNFAERDYASNEALIQNDLNYFFKHGQAQILHRGDKYGYDYNAHVHNYTGWMNWTFRYRGLRASFAGQIKSTEFWREGLYRKGLFAGLNEDGSEIIYNGESLTKYDRYGDVISSFGNSEKKQFTTYSGKAVLSYSLLGGHRFEVSGGYFTEAPFFNKAFISPRTRNTLIPMMQTTKVYSADATYSLNNNHVNFRITGFFAKIKDQTDVMSLYDDSQNTFTNFAMSGIDERHIGVEMGFKAPIFIRGLFIVGAASYGEYIYTSNPQMTQTYDNTTEVIVDNVTIPYWMSHPVFKLNEDGRYYKDDKGHYVVDRYQQHYVPSTPQLASTLGLSYNRNYWFLDANVNFFDKSYLAMNPLFRTDAATAGPDKIVTPWEIEDMTAQEKFKKAWVVNFSIGKSWYLHRKYQIGVNINVNNVLNNKNVKTGGFEQSRMVDNTLSKECYYKFDPKYYYMPGLNYMINFYVRF
ncbi:MAG: TonB-dependent receptor [Bacteroidales bacterium]|nr:TonB-dependent receptor [Bacteroidales bacterium]